MWPTAAPWLMRSCLEMSILPLLPRSVWAQINSFPTIPVSVCGPLRELYLFIVKQFSIRSTQANVTNGRERVGDGEITSYFGSGENRKYYYANGTEGPVCVCICVLVCVYACVSGWVGHICPISDSADQAAAWKRHGDRTSEIKT